MVNVLPVAWATYVSSSENAWVPAAREIHVVGGPAPISWAEDSHTGEEPSTTHASPFQVAWCSMLNATFPNTEIALCRSEVGR